MRRTFILQLYDQGELHVHGCPHCYDLFECCYDCTTEPDLDNPDDPRPVAPHDLCPACEWTRCSRCHNRMTDDGLPDLSSIMQGTDPRPIWKPAPDLDTGAPTVRRCDCCGHVWNATPGELL